MTLKNAHWQVMLGYKTDKNFYIQKEKISIITPNKKNQKNNMINRHQKRKLGYRFIIENTINGLPT